MISTHTDDDLWHCAKHNLNNSKCGAEQKIRLRGGLGNRYQFGSHQPTEGLESHGPR